jgi:hypothetical protein
MRAQMMQARDAAKTSALNDLSPDHRSKVQGIVDQFNKGSLSREDAATQIDGVLSPAESNAVLGEEQKFRDSMRQMFPSNGGGMGPGAAADHPQMQGQHGDRKPDAGRFLLMLSASPDALRQGGQPH